MIGVWCARVVNQVAGSSDTDIGMRHKHTGCRFDVFAPYLLRYYPRYGMDGINDNASELGVRGRRAGEGGGSWMHRNRCMGGLYTLQRCCSGVTDVPDLVAVVVVLRVVLMPPV